MAARPMWFYLLVAFSMFAFAVNGQQSASNNSSTTSTGSTSISSTVTARQINTTVSTVSTSSPKTSPPAAEAEKQTVPWWVILLITICFIHLVGGVAFAQYLHFKRRKNEKPAAAIEYRPVALIPVAELSPKSGIMETAVTAKEGPAESSGESKESAIHAKSVKSGRTAGPSEASSGDTMHNVPAVPDAHGKVATPAAKAGSIIGKSAIGAKTAIAPGSNVEPAKTPANVSG